MNQITARLFVYDVDREGGTVMHYAESDGTTIAVAIGTMLYPPGYYKVMENMHQKSGHTMTMEVDNEYGTVWTVRVGRGDFDQMAYRVKDAIHGMFDTIIIVEDDSESTNFNSPFNRN